MVMIKQYCVYSYLFTYFFHSSLFVYQAKQENMATQKGIWRLNENATSESKSWRT